MDILSTQKFDNIDRVFQIGDLHGRNKEPFRSAIRDFLASILNDQEINQKSSAFIFSGDIVDTPLQNGAITDILLQFVRKFEGLIIILQGNHEQSELHGSYLQAFYSYSNVISVIDNPVEMIFPDADNLNILFMPYFYKRTHNGRSMKEVYEEMAKEKKEYDVIIGHYFDETLSEIFGIIDTSGLQGRRSHGHYHIPEENYIGVPVISKSDERGIQPVIREITKTDFIDRNLQRYIDYYNVDMDEELPDTFEAIYPIVNVINSQNLVKDRKYFTSRGVYVNKITLKKAEKVTSIEGEIEINSIPHGMSLFIEKNKIKGKLAENLKGRVIV